MSSTEPVSPTEPVSSAEHAANRWLDRFFSAYYERRPVNATFVGVHDFDRELPDLSENGAGDTLAEMSSLLDASTDLEGPHLPPLLDVDVRLARGFLEIQRWEFEEKHFHRGNPSFYTGEAIFSILGLFFSDFAPLAERLESARERLNAIPDFLATARLNVREAPIGWAERAVRECDGALAFLEHGLGHVLGGDPGSGGNLSAATLAEITAAAERAASAFAAHRAYLDTTLRLHTTEHYACGEEALTLHLQRGHFIDTAPAEIRLYAESQMAEASAYLEEHAAKLGGSTPQAVLAQLADLHPTGDGYLQRYADLLDDSKRINGEKDLLTWPDHPIRFTPRPTWARDAAPYLYFLFYRSPAAFNRPAVHDYLVAPIDPDLSPADQEPLLRATNDSVIKLNHVIHHGGIGHHLQNWHAFRSRSRVGQIAAVDCASRIAMFCGGTMAEGWACYATDLMSEMGALTELEQYAEQATRVRMCARAVVDIELHGGRFTLEEAARYYVDKAGMPPAAAMGEAVKNSMFPGGAMMYLMGTDRIHALRREMEHLQGPDFSLRAFHDRFLSYGSIPVTLIAELMTREATGQVSGQTTGGLP